MEVGDTYKRPITWTRESLTCHMRGEGAHVERYVVANNRLYRLLSPFVSLPDVRNVERQGQTFNAAFPSKIESFDDLDPLPMSCQWGNPRDISPGIPNAFPGRHSVRSPLALGEKSRRPVGFASPFRQQWARKYRDWG